MSTGRKPNWTLCVKDSPDSPWRNIGAAWETEKGNLFLKLDDGEALEGTAMLFPYREKPAGAPRRPYQQPYRRPPAAKPPPPEPVADYMEQKRARQQPPEPEAPINPPEDENGPGWL